MASMAGLLEQAKAYLPEFVARKRRALPIDMHAALPSVTPHDRAETVAELIERQVIPRLMLVHRGEVLADATPSGGPTISLQEADDFAPFALDSDADVLLDHVELFLRRGVPLETIFVDLLAPAARRLGTMWDEDRCDFVDVTMGLWRLQEVLRELSSRMPALHAVVSEATSALFAPFPGELHSFGPVLVEDIFRRAGWATELLPDCSTPDLLDCLARRSFDMIGLTVSCDANIERLPSLILAIRSVSRNPRLCVMLGGRVLTADPELVGRVGADGTAADARCAVETASRLVAANTCREVFCA
jgi:MerR family transcriptional regulator, light-induced transcriptional regulator